MTTARERAEAMAREAATAFLDEYGLPEVYDAGVMLKKTTKHFLKHADRARNEALEDAAKVVDDDGKPESVAIAGFRFFTAAAIRALKEPTP